MIHHILFELLLERDFPGPIYEAFDFLGHTEPFHFILMDPHDIKIDGHDGAIMGPQLTLPKINRILYLQEYYFYLINHLQVLLLDDLQWLNITYKDIVEYLLHSKQHRRHQQPSPDHNLSICRNDACNTNAYQHAKTSDKCYHTIVDPHFMATSQLPSDDIVDMMYGDPNLQPVPMGTATRSFVPHSRTTKHNVHTAHGASPGRGHGGIHNDNSGHHRGNGRSGRSGRGGRNPRQDRQDRGGWTRPQW